MVGGNLRGHFSGRFFRGSPRSNLALGTIRMVAVVVLFTPVQSRGADLLQLGALVRADVVLCAVSVGEVHLVTLVVHLGTVSTGRGGTSSWSSGRRTHCCSAFNLSRIVAVPVDLAPVKSRRTVLLDGGTAPAADVVLGAVLVGQVVRLVIRVELLRTPFNRLRRSRDRWCRGGDHRPSYATGLYGVVAVVGLPVPVKPFGTASLQGGLPVAHVVLGTVRMREEGRILRVKLLRAGEVRCGAVARQDEQGEELGWKVDI